MALGTPTSLLSTGSGTDTTSYTTASVSPSANALLLLFVSNAAGTAGNNVKPNDPFGGTLGLTWHEIVSDVNVNNGLRGTWYWSATGGTPPTGTLQFVFSATQSSCQWQLTEITGADLTTPIVQSLSDQFTSTTNPSITLPNAIGSGNATFEARILNSTTAMTPGSGYTLLGTEQGASSPTIRASVAYDLTGTTTAGWTTTSTAQKTLFAIEVAEAAPAGTNIEPPAGALAIEGGANVKTPPTRTDHIAALSFPVIAAHRGGNPGPENTMFAFEAAAALDPTIILELDVRALQNVSSLGTRALGLSHDIDIDRMADPSSPFTTGDVAAFTAAEWATILFHENDGAGGAQSASFWHEVVTEWAGTSRIILAEPKTNTSSDWLIYSILDEGLEGQVIFQSFNLTQVEEAAAAGLHAYYIDNAPDIASLSAAGVDGVVIDYATLTGAGGATIVSDAHAAGMTVGVYTVDSTANRDTAIAAGADIIISNEPGDILLATAVEVTPPAGELEISGTAPAASAGANIEAPAGELTITGSAPVVSAGAAIEPPSGELSADATAPAISAGVNLAPTPGELTIDATPPVVAAGSSVPASITPPAGRLAISGTAPTVTVGTSIPAVIAAPAGVLTIDATAPELAAAANVAALAGLLALTATGPAIAAAVNLTPPAGELAIAATAPAVTTAAPADTTILAASVVGDTWSGSTVAAGTTGTVSPSGWSGA